MVRLFAVLFTLSFSVAMARERIYEAPESFHPLMKGLLSEDAKVRFDSMQKFKAIDEKDLKGTVQFLVYAYRQGAFMDRSEQGYSLVNCMNHTWASSYYGRGYASGAYWGWGDLASYRNDPEAKKRIEDSKYFARQTILYMDDRAVSELMAMYNDSKSSDEILDLLRDIAGKHVDIFGKIQEKHEASQAMVEKIYSFIATAYQDKAKVVTTGRR